MSKNLIDLLRHFPEASIHGPTNLTIEDVVFDSRQVKPKTLFVALKGLHVDGHSFIQAAFNQGGEAFLVQDPLYVAGGTVIQVPDTLRALSKLSNIFWDEPSKQLLMVGITGTNGKTTTTYLLESIFQKASRPCGVLGTINYRFGSMVKPASNTTPFASDLQRFLATILAKGAKAAVMEVSSHALELHRVDDLAFQVGVFTNLTQDHLDFHKTMDAYAAAKRRLFERVTRGAVINLDDPYAGYFKEACSVPVLSYGVAAAADVRAESIHYTPTGSTFVVHTPKGKVTISLPLIGDYNVHNALAAIAVGVMTDVSLDQIAAGVQNAPQVPGRVEQVHAGQPFTVVVDYAHTEDALRQVLQSLRKLKPKRLITVFGCGGDRDRTKRPLMGQAAVELSDSVWITSDNPRSEDPAKIALDIEVGARRIHNDRYHIELDRRTAIAHALKEARPGDVVLIAGKGHETYQILGSQTISFDDRAVARELLAG